MIQTEAGTQMGTGTKAIEEYLATNPNYKVAKLILQILEEDLGIPLPNEEIFFITMLLSENEVTAQFPKIGVVVLAHGRSTATSMIEVAHEMLGTNHGVAIDIRVFLAFL